MNQKPKHLMTEQELFEQAVNAMDNHAKAVEMGLTDFANYYDCISKELLHEIKARGLNREFEEYALVI